MKNDDAKWIERILVGDEYAFTALVKKYEKQIHAFVWRRVRDYHICRRDYAGYFPQSLRKTWHAEESKSVFRMALYDCYTLFPHMDRGEKKNPMQSLEAMSEAEVEALFYTQYMAEQIERSATEKQREIVEHLLQKLTDAGTDSSGTSLSE